MLIHEVSSIGFAFLKLYLNEIFFLIQKKFKSYFLFKFKLK